VEGTIDLQGLLHAILTCVTAGPGLGFNRAALFLADDDRRLVATMAIGPATLEDAQAIWARLASEQKSLDELLYKPQGEDCASGFQGLLAGLAIPLAEAAPPAEMATSPGTRPSAKTPAGPNPFAEAYRTRRVVRISVGASLDGLPPSLREALRGTEAVCVPLVAKDRCIGVMVADNAFNRKPIGEERTRVLQLLGLLAGLALDNARIYEQVDRQAKQLRETLDALKSTQEKLIHSERLATVGAVAARVSHEIRNPLTTIGGFAGMLRARPQDRVRVERNAAIIAEEVEKLEALLKEMLDFTSPRPPTLAPTDLNLVIGALADVHRAELSAENVALTVDAAEGLPPVQADPHQLQRVFLNLWRNAVQAMRETPADRKKALSVHTRRDGDAVKIACADTGEGIPPDVLLRIFTPFFTTKPRGTGLGLALVKKIIDDHNGNIDVQSKPGSGTTFTITLPVGRLES
jgi:signal transduction histidine kinase